MNPLKTKPWSLTLHKVFAQYKTNKKGLTESESEKRRQEYGLNSLEDKTQRHGLNIFISQFTSPLVLLLIGAASLAYFVGEKIDASVILAIILLNSLLGFFQEYKAERALRALKKLVTIRAKVLRDGNIKEIDAKNLMPGDIVQRSCVCDVCQWYNCTKCLPLANMGGGLRRYGASRNRIRSVVRCNEKF